MFSGGKRARELILKAKKRLGEELLILAHHYQRDEIVDVADYRGDSLELSRKAAASEARWIVFCGVHFMAETAAIVAGKGQRVLAPGNPGCYLAHPEDRRLLASFWEKIVRVIPEEIVPVAYVNTTAEVKAFVGKRGGFMCTSANAGRILSYVLSQGKRVLFLPDVNLGWNTARALGVSPEEIAIWDPAFPPSDLERFRRAWVILWRRACAVHTRFLPEDVERVRRERPDVRVVVHPECRPEVVKLADEVGSTSHIIKTVSTSPPRSTWAVGTEERLVARLAAENPDKEVFSLAEFPPFCPFMSEVRLEDLAWVLEGLLYGEERNVVEVPPEIANPARAALERMFGALG